MSDDFERDVFSSSSDDTDNTASEESSYEWNTDDSASQKSGEYRHSYVNGNNRSASHNPNNYDSAYSTPHYENSGASTDYTSQASGEYNYNSNSYNPNSANSYYNNQSSSYGSTQSGYNDGCNGTNYSGTQYSGYSPYTTQNVQPKKVKKQKIKKPKKPVSRGFIAGALVLTIICSAAMGFGGGYFAGNLSKSTSGSININKVDSSGTSAKNASADSESASSVVKKAADSVVEITTESVVTGSFARQYIAEGAGSGVIISEDGYIVTNNHVIEDARSITVTLRDGNTSYEAELIGTDADNDIALIKVDANGLSTATIGDSSNLAVGDYVVAIGNPLGELGGTVTDGIVSALAREVTIEEHNMTLLQTNAQINPGNSGGGLFNANGELIGIVNAKQSATEIEGIGFAIPVNNVMNVIDDLKTYGYVTGKVDTGMEFVDVNSNETAFYYGVNKIGCYVLSVTSDSNADKAGFRSGDYINSVDGTAVATSAEINAVLDKKEVGDVVTFNITRNRKTMDIKLTLAEYTPTMGNKAQNSNHSQDVYDDTEDSIWSEMFGWN